SACRGIAAEECGGGSRARGPARSPESWNIFMQPTWLLRALQHHLTKSLAEVLLVRLPPSDAACASAGSALVWFGCKWARAAWSGSAVKSSSDRRILQRN